MGLPTILFLIFLVLKLTHFIDWSWWWVTAPLWIEALWALFVFTVIGFGANRAAKKQRGFQKRFFR